MSTLTSSQLHVKRSSTRLHAPPGGASSITFGPGGLGTVDAAVDESEKAVSADPAALPPSRSGGYTSGSNNNYGGGGYDYAPPPTTSSSSAMYAKPRGSTPDYAAPGTNYGASSYGYNNNSNNNSGGGGGGMSSWGNQYAQTPPPMSAGRGGGGVGVGMAATSYGGRPVSSSSSRSWGSQPPLTSSKRDQNWERKRRQWLARKNGGGYRPQTNASMPMSMPMPPGSAYGSGTDMATPMAFGSGGGGGYSSPWDDLANANAPPSPLSKFVHQQSQKQGYGYGAFTDYERIGTAQSQAPPPTAAPGMSYSNNTSIGGAYGGVPPSRSGFASSSITHMGFGAPPPTSTNSNGAGMSHFRAPPDVATAPLSRGGTAAGMPTGTGSGGHHPATATARQPPGGHSNWSPFG